jgi:N-acetylglucosaminyl-diphospho-decaprenol L-rhamnosyltransferase
LLLNPDVTLRTPLDLLVEAAQLHGLAAGQLTEPDGRPQAGFTIRRLPTPMGLIFEGLGINWMWRNNPVNRRYRYADRDLNDAGPVEQPAGAFLMIRRDVWEKLGGFDEGFYPIWFEDVDFCRRALDAGYGIQYVPMVKASHEGGHSIRQMARGCRGRYWYGSLLRYAGKHFKPSAYRAVWLAAVLGALPRAAAGIMHEKSLRPASSVVDIFRFRVQRDRSSDRPPGTRRSG